MTANDGGGSTRRRVLKRLGAGAVVATLAGCGQRPEPTETETPPVTPHRTPGETPGWPPPEASDYGTVVDAVEAGADPNGGEPLNPVLESHAGDDTLLLLPRGEYLVDSFFELRGFERFGIVGDGAVIRPPDGYSGYLFGFGLSHQATGFLFKGITFDITAPNTGIRPLHATIHDDLRVEDVTVRGVQDTDQDSMRFDVTDPDGTGIVENLQMPDGGDSNYNITAVYVGGESQGTLTFKDCHVAGFPDNGLYASQARGPIRVIGGNYENNNIANVRVTTDAVVRGVTVRSDRALEGFNNVRGIRLRSGRNVLVEDCDVVFTDVLRSDGAIVLHDDLETATIRNTRIRVDTDGVRAITAKHPSVPDTSDIRIENVDISGRAADRAAVVVDGRGGNEFTGLCIHQSGPRRNGIRLIRSRDNLIADSWIHVTGEPWVLDNAEMSRRNVNVGDATLSDEGGSCSELRISRSNTERDGADQ